MKPKPGTQSIANFTQNSSMVCVWLIVLLYKQLIPLSEEENIQNNPESKDLGLSLFEFHLMCYSLYCMRPINFLAIFKSVFSTRKKDKKR